MPTKKWKKGFSSGFKVMAGRKKQAPKTKGELSIGKMVVGAKRSVSKIKAKKTTKEIAAEYGRKHETKEQRITHRFLKAAITVGPKRPMTVTGIAKKMLKLADVYNKPKRLGTERIKPKKPKKPYISPATYRKALFGTGGFPIYYPLNMRGKGPSSIFQLLNLSTAERQFLKTGRVTKYGICKIEISNKGIKLIENYLNMPKEVKTGLVKTKGKTIPSEILKIIKEPEKELKGLERLEAGKSFRFRTGLSIMDKQKLFHEISNYLTKGFLSAASDYYVKNLEKYVPEETGELKRTLRESLYSGYMPPVFPTSAEQLRLEINFHSDVPYLDYVNRAEQHGIIIRHHRSQKIRSRKTGRYLHDPEAVSGFIFFTQKKLQTYLATKEVPLLLSFIIKTFNCSLKEARSFFKFTGLGTVKMLLRKV